MRPLLSPPPHLPNVRVNSHVSLFRRKFWDLKVMYRASAADFLALQGFCANNPGIPPQMSQKGDYTHLVDFLRLSSMQKVVLFGGCSNRGLEGLVRNSRSRRRYQAQERSIPAAVPTALHGGRRPGSGRPSTTLENILPQERYQLVSDQSLKCLPCAAQIHTRR